MTSAVLVRPEREGGPSKHFTARPGETRLGLVRRARQIHRILAERHAGARLQLRWDDPFQLLVAGVLAAQTTDERVNSVTPELFAAYPDAAALAGADPADLEEMLRPVGYYRLKTEAVQKVARRLVSEHLGRVPRTLDALVAIPWVGRKTANMVLANAYGRPALTVDTHVGRLSARWGWTDAWDPADVEAEVTALFPRRDWAPLADRATAHGRRICHSRKPACGACPLAALCPSYGVGETDPERAAGMVKS
ncbi:endonuclease III [Plantactinospora sp. ZYX-F-223]|uniref:endonuclease III n=1 Tax=Plantactinospora sp. ZYX-F-223 TaxID=3144103 RepID=UPI0031FCD142